MKSNFYHGFFLLAFLVMPACSCAPEPQKDAARAAIDWVDPFIGTGGGGYAQAQTFVGACVPFGLAKPGPDSYGSTLGRTGFAHTAGYWYLDDHIDGLSQLHLHGTGAEDFGNFLLTASDASLPGGFVEDNYMQWFRHSKEQASPGYYAVTLEDSDTLAELTASAHAAFHRYTFAEGAQPMLLVDMGHGLGRVGGPFSKIDVADSGASFSGDMIAAGRFTGEGRAYAVFVSARLNPAPERVEVFADGALLDVTPQEGTMHAEGQRSGARFYFNNDVKQVQVRLGMSYIDAAHAEENRGEIDARSFDQVQQAARDIWQKFLSRVEVEGGTDDDKTIFYTALYHTMMMPTQMREADGSYMGLDRQQHRADDFVYHSDFSLWDTYRTLHPLMALVYPEKQRDFARSLLAMSAQYGAPPRWPLAVNDGNSMQGSPASIVLAESLLKGIDLDAAATLQVIVDDADMVPGHTIRNDFSACHELGFCPADEIGNSVSKSVEYGWADFAISLAARAQADDETAQRFLRQSQNWRAHWDSQTQFVRGRNRDGSWNIADFDPTAFSDNFAEGDAWQYTWSAPYDLNGLIELFGSVDATLDKLDQFFQLAQQTPRPMPIEPFAGYELYYWHGNEPDLDAAYLYALAGQPQRGIDAIDWVRRTKYASSPDGLDGNDDAGTLSAWYVFSALGIYPLAGTPWYIIGTPLFERVVLHLPSGDLEILAPGVDAQHRYIKSVKLNGESVERPWLLHQQLVNGGRLEFEMSATATNWGQGEPLDVLDF